MTAEDHLAWCKRRALALCNNGDPEQGLTSFVSDLRKHPETRDHGAIDFALLMQATGNLKTTLEAREFIEGFR